MSRVVLLLGLLLVATNLLVGTQGRALVYALGGPPLPSPPGGGGGGGALPSPLAEALPPNGPAPIRPPVMGPI